MPFDEKDVETAPVVTLRDTVEEIRFVRNRDLPGVPLEITVMHRVETGGEPQRVAKRVPAAIVDANWPGGSRTLRAHLFAIIDVAV